MVSIKGLFGSGLIKLVLLGVATSVILALNIPAKLGFAGGIIGAGILLGVGIVIRKVGVPTTVASGFPIAVGVLLGSAFIAPAVAGAIGGIGMPSSQALTLSQRADPIVREFR